VSKEGKWKRGGNLKSSLSPSQTGGIEPGRGGSTGFTKLRRTGRTKKREKATASGKKR